MNGWVCAGKHISEVHDLQHDFAGHTGSNQKVGKELLERLVALHRDPLLALAENLRDLYWRSLLTTPHPDRQ